MMLLLIQNLIAFTMVAALLQFSGSYAIADQSAGNAYPNVNPSAAADIVNTAQSAYAAADPYDDAVADPEPDCFYDGSCSPPVGSGSYAIADQSAGNAYTNVNPSAAAAIVNTAQSAYAAADPYDDAVADPEPDC